MQDLEAIVRSLMEDQGSQPFEFARTVPVRRPCLDSASRVSDVEQLGDVWILVTSDLSACLSLVYSKLL